MEMSGHVHAPTALPRVKRSWYPLKRRLGGSQRLSELCGEKKSPLRLPGIKPRPSIPYPVVIQTDISLLVGNLLNTRMDYIRKRNQKHFS
jgi:hypothetical protein